MFRRAGCGPWLGRACVHKDGGRARLPRIVSLLLARTRLPAMLTSRPPPHARRPAATASDPVRAVSTVHGCRGPHPLRAARAIRGFFYGTGSALSAQCSGRSQRHSRQASVGVRLAGRHDVHIRCRSRAGGFRPRPVACSSMPPRQSWAQASLPPSRPREIRGKQINQ